ncbi:hypothetical protein Nepgr_028162 [Nepenthes gracilis]|uniref:Myb/SANT-like DNA-binding domain-containing protein n=1 Tax=Nepenthes gracilis TaxID=150966 RepID=A0AAD3TBN9_NEPGR|nr:hypothetical protein Nepgr_028162 [Nepenthes gracilis]
METSGLSGRMFSNLSSEMLGLEMPLEPPAPPQKNPHHHQRQQQPPQTQMVGFDQHEAQPQLSMKQTSSFMPLTKQQNQQPANSDEDEPGCCANDDSSVDGKRKISPWHRMKWTDNMVRLLIMAVYYIGDEVGSEGNDKKRSGVLLQKKGKWKSVSRAMMAKGFYVSPQQCEDKFNDLNKRYKRVNDILGKGTACRVVENQSLLETMEISPKMKEEARKLLNSKHLFFREMCAYHHSCGHVGSGGGGAATTGVDGNHHSPEVAPEQSHVQQHQQQQCLHPPYSQAQAPGSNRDKVATEESSRTVKGGSGEDEEDDFDDDAEEEEEDDDDDYDDDDHDYDDHDHDEDDHRDLGPRKRARRKAFVPSTAGLTHQIDGEILSVLQDGSKTSWEKKQWMLSRLTQLEEQGLKYQYEAFELEKQRLKWVKFRSKKEREMERMKLENERRRLENQRMLLLLRQKELELT